MTVRITLYTLWVLTVFLSPLGVLGISTIGSSGILGVLASDVDVDPSQSVSVVVRVAGGISASDLCAELDSTCVTLHERRQKGVLLLLDRAERTQVAVLEELRRLESQGLAANIEIKWLTNGIAVDLAPSEVSGITRRPDVFDVFEPPIAQPMEPVFRKDAPSRSQGSIGGAEDNLRFIGADSAWKMGYTGEGRVVCHLDGVDGNHPALYDNWKGHDGDSAAAWAGDGGFPTPIGDHGTLVMGIMVGRDTLSGDTIGVAPGATWIAGWPSDWEWAADPDGNPYTTDDVPDAIALTKAFGTWCGTLWWNDIDMVEALGTVVAVSAGNRGRDGSRTVGTPANRAVDSLTIFAVGSCHHVDGTVSAFSSRGPSTCDSISIKPNVSAPGGWIRTSTLDGAYKYTGGTSLSAPHVAGAVAILRQYAPNATASEVKEALLAGCTDAGSPGPDNDYGWGIINIPASMEYLSPGSPADIRVKSFTYEPTDVDDTLIGVITIKNRGCQMDDVYAVFSNDYSGFRVIEDSVSFGNLALNDTAAAEIRLVPDSTIHPGELLTIPFEFADSQGHRSHSILRLQVGIQGERTMFTHESDRMRFTVSNHGRYGMLRLGGVGFQYRDSVRSVLYDGSLMLGLSPDQVSDGSGTEWRDPANDFWVHRGDTLGVSCPGSVGDQETFCVYDDGQAEDWIGIRILQRTISWKDPDIDNFVILGFLLQNCTDDPISGLYVGLCLEWIYSNEIILSSDEHLAYSESIDPYGGRLATRGLAVLSGGGASSFASLPWAITESDSIKYEALSGGIPSDTIIVRESGWSGRHVLSTGPFTLQPGECDTAAFAVIGADSLSEMKATALRARDKWRGIAAKYAQPERFWLDSNYPNPFNARTTISYTLLDPAHVTLEVYNILGQRVETVMDGFMASGRHTASWDATDFASGVYFVSMTVGETSQSRKLLLLK